MSFDGYKVQKPSTSGVSVKIEHVSVGSFPASTAMVQAACKNLVRLPPSNLDIIGWGLMRRNAAVAYHADTMVAVGTMKGPSLNSKRVASRGASNVQVDGETGVTCQMFVEKCVNQLSLMDRATAVLPLYLYASGHWHQCRFVSGVYHWKLCAVGDIVLNGVCAFIGSRDLTMDSHMGINSLVEAVKKGNV